MFNKIPSNLDRTTLREFSDLFGEDAVEAMFKSAKSFQHATLYHWNPHCDAVTKSKHMGLIDIGGAASNETFALGLHFQVKFGMLVHNHDGTWQLADDYKPIMHHICLVT